MEWVEDQLSASWVMHSLVDSSPMWYCGLFRFFNGRVREAVIRPLWSESGIGAAGASRQSIKIITYHRFSKDSSILETQCHYLKNNFQVLSLSNAINLLTTNSPLDSNLLVITVDDGYQDYFTCAASVFLSAQIPVTIFLTSGFLDRECWLWVDQIRWLINHTAEKRLELNLPGGRRRVFDLTSPEKQIITIQTIKQQIKDLAEDQRIEVIDRVTRLLDLRLPKQPPDDYAPLTWMQVRQLAACGVEFGAHTVSHPILSRIRNDAQLRHEICESRRRIEKEIGSPVVHFCYPNGRAGDIGTRVIETVKACGFHSASTLIPGINRANDDLFLLKRIGVEPDLPEPLFRHCLAGSPVDDSSNCNSTKG